MAQTGTRRLIVLSSAGLGVPRDAAPAVRLFARLLHRIMLKSPAATTSP